jgi:hypothetical protein
VSFVLAPLEGAGEGLQRVIREQAEKLAVECLEAMTDTSAFAHKARVRCKRVRAALRLARPLMKDKAYREQNQWWRDLARLLSELRDAGARLEALESLRPFLAQRIGSDRTRALEELLRRQQQSVDAAAPIAEFRERLDTRGDLLVPDLKAGGRNDMVAALGETYRQVRRTMKEALEHEDPELLHEWRKQAKYHALQVRLLRQQFPDALDRRVAGVRDLAELLGEAGDIHVVTLATKRWRDRPAGFHNVLAARRKALVTGARATGAALFAEKPKAWMETLSPPVMAE